MNNLLGNGLSASVYPGSLIDEVKQRRPLWDKSHEHYKSFVRTQILWAEIAKIIGRSESQLQKKWRNFRDQFLRECKRLNPIPGSSETLQSYHYTGKWVYFEKLFFLKGAGHELLHLKVELVDNEEPANEEANLHANDASYAAEDAIPAADVAIFATEGTSSTIENFQETIRTPEKMCQASQTVAERKRKRPAVDPALPGTSSSYTDGTELTDGLGGAEMNDDYHFVMSLVPYLRMLTPIKKLRARSEIHDVLITQLELLESTMDN